MEKNSWDRIKGESYKAFMAFQVYLKLGTERTVAQVAREIKRSDGLVYKWSGQHDWIERSTQYEEHRTRLQREAEEKADQEYWAKQRIEFRKNQMKVGSAMYNVGASALPELRKRAAILNAHEVAKLVETGSKEVSRALGDPDIIAESRGGVPASGAVIDAPFAQFLMDWAKNPKGQSE